MAEDLSDKCKFRIVETPEGKRLESDCVSKEAARQLQDMLEQEVIIRVKPTSVTQEDSEES